MSLSIPFIDGKLLAMEALKSSEAVVVKANTQQTSPQTNEQLLRRGISSYICRDKMQQTILNLKQNKAKPPPLNPACTID